MLRRVLLSALAAGLLAGAMISAVQSFTTTPIILHAESYEGEPPAHVSALETSPLGALAARLLPEAQAHEAGDHDGEATAWAPQDGLERLFYTLSANLLLGTAFALLVVAGFVLHGREVTALSGILWGGAGFVVFTLAPSLGLPPEVPGALAADLLDRQLWWAGAAGAAAVGLGLVVFARGWPLKGLGIAVAFLPHLLGAPQPEAIGGNVPPELAGHFAAASIVVSAIFWALLGSLSAAFYRRFA